MRIASPVLGIAPGSNSGGEVFDRELLNALVHRGVEVEVLLPKNRPYIPHKKLKVAYAPIKPMVPPYIFNWFTYRYLLHLYSSNPFDVIRVHSPYFVGPGAGWFKQAFPHVPLIVNYHHLDDDLLQQSLDSHLIKKWDAITVDSEFTKQQILTRYGEMMDERITVVPAGVTVNGKLKGEMKFNLTKWKGKRKLLFLNGLKKRKNPAFLLQVLSRLDDRFVLIIAGKGELERQLQKMTTALGLHNRVLFWGYVEEDEKACLYSWADVMLLPSLMEGFGMTVLEAGLEGTPTIVSDRGALPELVRDNQTGWIRELQVEAWTSVLENLQPTQLNNMSRLIKEHARSYTWDRAAEIFIGVAEKLIKN